MPPVAHAETGTAHVSASRESNFIDCERKYWWSEGPYKIKGPEKPHFALGTAVHLVAEQWLRDGTPPPDTQAGRIFAPGAAFWPRPGLVEVESPFATTIEGRLGEAFTGTMDVWDPNAHILALWSGAERIAMQREFGTYALPVVGDHKTTKAEGYVKTVGDLRTNAQVIDYGMEALRRKPAPAVAFQWVYYRTQGPAQAWVVRFVLSATYLEEQYALAQLRHQEMVDVVQIGNYTQVPYNRKACNKFGGCEFLDYCFGGKLPKEIGVTKIEKLLAEQGINPPAAPPVQPVQATAPSKGPIFAKAATAQAAPTPAPAPPPTPQKLPTPEVIAAPASPKATTPPVTQGASPGFMLLVDATCDKAPFQPEYVTEIFADALAEVATTFKQPNWRYIPYGEGAAAIAKAVDDYLDAHPYSGVIRLDTGTAEGNALLPVLFPRANFVIRGVK